MTRSGALMGVNTLIVTMCTPFHSALMVRLLLATMVALGVPKKKSLTPSLGATLLSGQMHADPCSLKRTRIFKIVRVKEPLGSAVPGKVWFCIMYAMLFGLYSSVVQFARWSRFLEALMRRIMGSKLFVDVQHV